MRKVLILAAVLGIGWTLQGCKKEKNTLENKNQVRKYGIEDVRSNDGELIFENEQHMFDVLMELSRLSFQERLNWENNLNFRSLFSAEALIHNAEDMHQTSFFRGIDPDISMKDLELLNLAYVPSDLFREYQAKGIVSYIKNEDGSNSIQLNFEYDFYKYIVGEKMTFIAGKMKYDFNKQYLRITNTDTQEEVALIDKNETEKNGTGNDKWHKGIGLNAGQRSYFREYGSTKRVRSYIEFDTKLIPNQGGDPDKNSMSLNMFWVNQAEQKKWGNWAMRDSYEPITQNYGLWYIWYEYTSFSMPDPNAWYTAYHGTSFGPNPCVIQPNGSASKILNITYGSGTNNQLITGMPPSGYYLSASWFNFRRALATFQDNYFVKISGNDTDLVH